MSQYRVKKLGYYYGAEKKWLCFWFGLPHGICASYANAHRVCIDHARMERDHGKVYPVNVDTVPANVTQISSRDLIQAMKDRLK